MACAPAHALIATPRWRIHLAVSFEELLAENAAQHPTWDQETLALFTTAKRQLDDRVHHGEIVKMDGWREDTRRHHLPGAGVHRRSCAGAPSITKDVAQAALARCDHLTREHVPGGGPPHSLRGRRAVHGGLQSLLWQRSMATSDKSAIQQR